MSITGHCFKNKGDATERGNYKELKLLEHMVMVFDSVNKQKIWEVVDINVMQFVSCLVKPLRMLYL